jgi:hypothetical protein
MAVRKPTPGLEPGTPSVRGDPQRAHVRAVEVQANAQGGALARSVLLLLGPFARLLATPAINLARRSSRCQRSSVAGVTTKPCRRRCGSKRASAAIKGTIGRPKPWRLMLTGQDRELAATARAPHPWRTRLIDPNKQLQNSSEGKVSQISAVPTSTTVLSRSPIQTTHRRGLEFQPQSDTDQPDGRDDPLNVQLGSHERAAKTPMNAPRRAHGLGRAEATEDVPSTPQL